MILSYRQSIIATALLAGAVGCRGSVSEEPPIHIIPDMDYQQKYQPDEESAFFADGKANRDWVDGVVPRSAVLDDTVFTEGRKDGGFVLKVPVEVTEKTVRRGQERFNIYCAPCHDASGSGRGIVVQRGYPLPVNLASDHTRGLPDGEIFDIITKGVRNMPSYGAQVPAADRWAIVSWVRVLQRSQYARIDDVPENQRGNIEEAAQ